MEEEFENLSKEELLNRTVIETVIMLKDVEMRERMLAKLEVRAKELKVSQNFKRLYKVIQAEIIQSQKQLNSFVTEFTKAPIKLKCKNYICNDLGVVKSEFNQVLMTSVDTVICTHPILPVERLINVDTNIEKVKLAFYKDKRWQTVIAEKNTLASKNKILQLANTGIEVNENNAKDLIIYISDLLTINTETIPVYKSIERLGWTENGFAPYIEKIKFDGENTYQKLFNSMTEKGDYELWKEHIKKCINYSLTFRILLMASFANPLIDKLGCNCFCVHFWGGTGVGKTVALMTAMSVWGNPDKGKLVSSINGTVVAISRKASFLRDIPFAGDELQTIKTKSENYDDIIMQLTEGIDRSRGKINGGLEELKEWNCIFLFTGEEPITKTNSGGGVKNRVIEVETTEKVIENGNYTANFVRENYGFAGKEFIGLIENNIENLKEEYRNLQEEILNQTDTTEKQAMAMASILIADKIVSEQILDIPKMNIDDIKTFLTSKLEVNSYSRAYELIIDWIRLNENKFSLSNNYGECWGVIKNNICYINPMILYDFLKEKGFDFNAIKDSLFKEHKILKDSQGKFTTNKRIDGMQGRKVAIVLDCEEKNNIELPF